MSIFSLLLFVLPLGRLFGWREHGEVKAQGPLPEHYLMNNLKMCAQNSRFEGRHEEPLRQDIGFFLEMLCGGVLTPDGTLRPDANTLVIVHTKDFREGYERGRRDYFTQYEEIATRKTICSKHTLRITYPSAESKARSVGRLVVRLGNSPGSSSRSPNRNNHTSILHRRSSALPFCTKRKRRVLRRGERGTIWLVPLMK
jgi:hypothetical protein